MRIIGKLLPTVLSIAAVSGLTATPAQAAPLPTGEIVLAPAGATTPLRLQSGLDNDGDLRAALNLGAFRFLSDPALPRQRFGLIPYSGSTMFLVCSHSVSVNVPGGLPKLSCIDIANDQTTPGASVVLRPFDGTASQVWRIQNEDPTRPATVGLRNLGSGLMLSVAADAPAANRALIQTAESDAVTSQGWFITAAR